MPIPTFGLPTDHPILTALATTMGAQFFRCALQVNPFQYLLDFGKPLPEGITTEEEYNTQLVAALVAHEVHVIAITDHWRARTASSLLAAAEAAGIIVFPGFEAATRQGTHILCLFNPGTDLRTIDRIGEDLCETHTPINDARDGRKELPELVDFVQNQRGGICLAAHILQNSGLLFGAMNDQRRIDFRYSELWAGCIPGTLGTLSSRHSDKYSILDNRDSNYQRARKLALLNANDVSSPAQVADACSTSYIKLDALTVEGLRQAFLDPTSRIRLNGDQEPDGYWRLEVVTWQGGPLEDLTIRWNENLNVLIGGRGAGKSSVLETVRYAFELKPNGAKATKAHEGVVRAMLQNGGQVSIVVRTSHVVPHYYLIRRAYGGSAQVIDANGQLQSLTPREAVGALPAVYGQHEIAELAEDGVKLTELLARFQPDPTSLLQKKTALKNRLTATRERLQAITRDLATAEEQLSQLPALRQRLQEYKAAGLEDKLRVESQWNSEGGLFAKARQQLVPIDELIARLRQAVPLNLEAVSPPKLTDSPNATLLQTLPTALRLIEDALRTSSDQLNSALTNARTQIAQTESNWKPLRAAADETFQATLRQLQTEKIDGSAYLKLERQLEDLQPIERQKEQFKIEQGALERQRQQLLSEWEDALANEFRTLRRTAESVTSWLQGGVRVQIRHQTQRQELLERIRIALAANGGGPYAPILDAISSADTVSVRALASACRSRDTVALRTAYPTLTEAQAQRLGNINPLACLELEELELGASTTMELNVAEASEPTDWRTLDKLSVGQKATAILRLLLLSRKDLTEAPLLVDQPEDDLDNRFITDAIVPTIKAEKMRRQFIFTTHNANVPVLGDAELIIGLRYQRGDDRDRVNISASGALETPAVHQLVERVLEGGKEAFEIRRLKYNY